MRRVHIGARALLVVKSIWFGSPFSAERRGYFTCSNEDYSLTGTTAFSASSGRVEGAGILCMSVEILTTSLLKTFNKNKMLFPGFVASEILSPPSPLPPPFSPPLEICPSVQSFIPLRYAPTSSHTEISYLLLFILKISPHPLHPL
jgi:hypothetical protein